ncbi:UDP-N-acetylglucosamine transporter YEA4 [Colletotrichum graminicola M1.001]|uniref:UDP-N-acetylglucosamine transporter YEA4 n=1 Tax=Colletotrichum graminicola (strain M1.001 / M2 / FGSC 10212) TaxID=645133 RepID=E3QDJ1_COLGM|nr:UDP-N-acetylglucosamine transporter YEA4 [Colletotrichum graminicola M1.001]EFQ28696.1 UDP-N-acetylglucosamine transporter YEA4 [Colletotrichum graminicola M1.001]
MSSLATTRRRGQPKGISPLSLEKMDTTRGHDDEKIITDDSNGTAMNGCASTEKPMQAAGRIIAGLSSQWIAVGVMLGLIFGGCCSNVGRLGPFSLSKRQMC